MVCIGRDYRVATTGATQAGIYLQGATEHSHGIGSTLLSNTAVRAGEILGSILAHDAQRGTGSRTSSSARATGHLTLTARAAARKVARRGGRPGVPASPSASPGAGVDWDALLRPSCARAAAYSWTIQQDERTAAGDRRGARAEPDDDVLGSAAATGWRRRSPASGSPVGRPPHGGRPLAEVDRGGGAAQRGVRRRGHGAVPRRAARGARPRRPPLRRRVRRPRRPLSPRARARPRARRGHGSNPTVACTRSSIHPPASAAGAVRLRCRPPRRSPTDEFRHPPPVCRPMTSTLAIEAAGLVKSFGKTRAVDGVDLAVQRGAVYGVLGPNGAGKTTTIRMLATLLRPDAGQRTGARARRRRRGRRGARARQPDGPARLGRRRPHRPREPHPARAAARLPARSRRACGPTSCWRRSAWRRRADGS